MALTADYWNLADRLMRFIYRETRLPMIVCDGNATIIRAIDPSRIGSPHSGSQQILSGAVDEYVVTAEEAAANPLIKEGYNCPIIDAGQRIGTFGVGGPIKITRPVGKVAAMVLASWAKEAKQQAMLHHIATRIVTQSDQMRTQLDQAADKAAQIENTIADRVSEGLNKVKATDSILNKIHQISQQSHILSINGSVEASRAGEHGRAFAVVAEQMTELAGATRTAAADILKTLEEIRAVIGNIHDASNQAATGSHEQLELMSALIANVATLQESISDLEKQFNRKLD